jgi:hypothetical protein
MYKCEQLVACKYLSFADFSPVALCTEGFALITIPALVAVHVGFGLLKRYLIILIMIFLGGRCPSGSPIITFPGTPLAESVAEDEIILVLTYLLSVLQSV